MNLDELLQDLRIDYIPKRLFDGEKMDADPIKQLQQWVQEAFDAKVPELNAMILSTVSLSGGVSSRVVLLKELTEEGLFFYTNYQSQKGLEMAANSNVAVNFFWQPLSRQVRVQGKVVQVTEVSSDEYFVKRPRGSQITAWASPQSQPVKTREELEELVEQCEKKFADTKPLPRPVFWGGYRIIPNYFEFWQGNQNRLHDRICYRRLAAGEWESVRLAP